MASPRTDDEHDDGALRRELEVMREIEQIVRWHPAPADRAPGGRVAGDEPRRASGPDGRDGLSRRRPAGG